MEHLLFAIQLHEQASFSLFAWESLLLFIIISEEAENETIFPLIQDMKLLIIQNYYPHYILHFLCSSEHN